jgi:hypothetical protein
MNKNRKSVKEMKRVESDSESDLDSDIEDEGSIDNDNITFAKDEDYYIYTYDEITLINIEKIEKEINEVTFVIPEKELKDYLITKSGKLINTLTTKIVKGTKRNGYYNVTIKGKCYAIHRLVAKTFHPQPVGKNVVNHINENKEDNRAENLEWVTQKENTHKHSKEISHSRKVKQIDMKTNEVIKIFDQITEAANAVGVTRRAIQLVLDENKKNKTAGGYFWEYVDDTNRHDNLNQNELSEAVKIYDFDTYYVFKNGRIYNSTNKKYLKPVKNAAGRYYVTLCRNSKKENLYVQRIVADHFLPNKPADNSEVEHINHDQLDNNVENLKWSKSKQSSIVSRKILYGPNANIDNNKDNEKSEDQDNSNNQKSDEGTSKQFEKGKAKEIDEKSDDEDNSDNENSDNEIYSKKNKKSDKGKAKQTDKGKGKLVKKEEKSRTIKVIKRANDVGGSGTIKEKKL